MDLNRFSYYRANPYASNDYISAASMTNRKHKEFPSEIPQGEQHLTARPGKRIFKNKAEENQIKKDHILNSPERYPYQNRIALEKSYPRNLDTIDIQGATAGTKVSESIRNKHKALQELRRRNHQQVKLSLMGESLDEVYEQKKRKLAGKIQKNIQMRKTKDSFSHNHNTNNTDGLQDSRKLKDNGNQVRLTQGQVQAEYERYVSHNSNTKYHGIAPNSFEFQGFQRYRRPQGSFQTLDSYNNGRIPEHINRQRPIHEHNRHLSIDMATQNFNPLSQNDRTNYRGLSTDSAQLNTPNSQNTTPNRQASYMNNSYININNRHRSNPEYIDKFPSELQKRVEQTNKDKKIEQNLKSIYQNDRAQFRRHNPTNLSFNIAAKNSLMGPIV